MSETLYDIKVNNLSFSFNGQKMFILWFNIRFHCAVNANSELRQHSRILSMRFKLIVSKASSVLNNMRLTHCKIMRMMRCRLHIYIYTYIFFSLAGKDWI